MDDPTELKMLLLTPINKLFSYFLILPEVDRLPRGPHVSWEEISARYFLNLEATYISSIAFVYHSSTPTHYKILLKEEKSSN